MAVTVLLLVIYCVLWWRVGDIKRRNPWLDQHPDFQSQDRPSFIAGESIEDSCLRLFIVVPRKDLVRLELVLPDRTIELDTIVRQRETRVFQCWFGLDRLAQESYLTIDPEELSADGLEINESVAAFWPSVTFAVAGKEVRLRTVKPGELLGDRFELLYAEGKPVVYLQLNPVTQEEIHGLTR